MKDIFDIMYSNLDECIEIDKELARKIGLKESMIFTEIKNTQHKQKYVQLHDILNKLPFIEKKSITTKLKKLINNKYVISITIKATDKEKILKSKNLNGHGIGDKCCSWCKMKTTMLHEHHFPIPKKDGGTELVSICPNCHCEFHGMTNYYNVVQLHNRRKYTSLYR